MKHSKAYKAAAEKRGGSQLHTPEAAMKLVKEMASAKFDETIEVAVRLGVDPRKADQMVRGTVNLPNGTGKTARVLVFASGEKAEAAIAAGADEVGVDDLVEKISGGYLDFDAVVATPDMMKDVGRLGMVLGRKGLMPNPKTGTVTNDIVHAIGELKKGRTEFRADKGGVIHIAVGKVSMDPGKIAENVDVLLNEVRRRKPVDAKAGYIATVSLSSTMGPGVWIDYKEGE